MAIINWTDDLSVKIDKFDNQHKKLISLLNDLYDAMKIGEGKNVIADVLKGLIDYTQYHFNSEEEAFKKYNYPDFEKHKKEHNDLMQKAYDLQKDYNEGKILVTVETLNFLNTWVSTHIKGSDKEYSDYLKDKVID